MVKRRGQRLQKLLRIAKYGVVLFSVKHGIVSATDVSNFNELQTSLGNQDANINVTATPINYGGLLGITYDLTIQNQMAMPVVFDGTGAATPFFSFGFNLSNPVVNWNGDFNFINTAIINPQGGVGLGGGAGHFSTGSFSR